MDRQRFALSSEQLELLLAFENASGLNHLAELMARDPSVVSRNLQRIAEDYPVLVKVKGRWELTPLGHQINQRTRAFIAEQNALFSDVREPKPHVCSKDSILIVINAQNGLLDATQEGRNNLNAEANISRLLNHWRENKRRIIHVKHVSDNPASRFYRESTGCNFLPFSQPLGTEAVIEKSSSSAFTGTTLESTLDSSSEIVLAGFTASECIDATARDASAKGFTTFVVGDGTATFDLRDPSGKLVKAERIHKLTLLNINAFYAKVVTTSDLLLR